MAAKHSSNELMITRLYDAPLKIVWAAWTDPKQAAQWWGPRGFTITTHSKDLRPGGSWRYTMHGPDGVDYPNTTKYLEVVDQSKLVYDHGATDDRPPLFRVTVLFSESNGKTKMELRMTLPTPEAAQETARFIKKAGGDATWDRLAEYLEHESSGREKFVINRSFEAPIDLMFEMWASPEHSSRWSPPSGFEMKFIEAQIRPGGSSFYVMTGPGGAKMFGRANYLELEKPHRIVYTQQFCDEQGKISRHPMSPTWPETMLTIVTFTAEGPDQTRVTVTWEPYGTVATDELETFVKARGGMTQGWTGSFDKLEAYLAER
ncbi:MAG: SRPBCC domain-containing protein [Oligoflexia bacterium]|nr:SRPBCC domain-containing protein [Oligoflexia bacterium]